MLTRKNAKRRPEKAEKTEMPGGTLCPVMCRKCCRKNGEMEKTRTKAENSGVRCKFRPAAALKCIEKAGWNNVLRCFCIKQCIEVVMCKYKMYFDAFA